MSPPPTYRTPSHTITSPNASLPGTDRTTRTSTSRPEGWWSSDEAGEVGEVGSTGGLTTGSSTPANKSPTRRSSFDSTKSMSGRKFGAKGITLGASKAVSGVDRGEGVGRERERLMAQKKGNVLRRKTVDGDTGGGS